jgi:hypothetical protein
MDRPHSSSVPELCRFGNRYPRRNYMRFSDMLFVTRRRIAFSQSLTRSLRYNVTETGKSHRANRSKHTATDSPIPLLFNYTRSRKRALIHSPRCWPWEHRSVLPPPRTLSPIRIGSAWNASLSRSSANKCDLPT